MPQTNLKLVNVLIYTTDNTLLLDTVLIDDMIYSLKNPCVLFEKLLYEDILPAWDLNLDEPIDFIMRMTPIRDDQPPILPVSRVRRFRYHNGEIWISFNNKGE